MNTLHAPHGESRRRHQRWRNIALVVLAGLALYVAGLGWVAQQLQESLVATIQPAPVLEDRQHSPE